MTDSALPSQGSPQAGDFRPLALGLCTFDKYSVQLRQTHFAINEMYTNRPLWSAAGHPGYDWTYTVCNLGQIYLAIFHIYL